MLFPFNWAATDLSRKAASSLSSPSVGYESCGRCASETPCSVTGTQYCTHGTYEVLRYMLLFVVFTVQFVSFQEPVHGRSMEIPLRQRKFIESSFPPAEHHLDTTPSVSHASTITSSGQSEMAFAKEQQQPGQHDISAQDRA